MTSVLVMPTMTLMAGVPVAAVDGGCVVGVVVVGGGHGFLTPASRDEILGLSPFLHLPSGWKVKRIPDASRPGRRQLVCPTDYYSLS
jgi:hypothetical protein